METTSKLSVASGRLTPTEFRDHVLEKIEKKQQEKANQGKVNERKKKSQSKQKSG